MTKVTVHFNEASREAQTFEANGFDLLSCGVLAVRVEVVALKNSLLASVSKERTIYFPLSSISWFEVED